MMPMDITQLPGSRILDIARIAFATPDVDFLCFGESDQPSPASAHAAAIAALDAGITRYPDVRGLPELRAALADYLTGLHARPVSEQRIQITASGMAEHRQRSAAAWRAGGRTRSDSIARRRLSPRPRPAGCDAARRARIHS